MHASEKLMRHYQV